MHVYYNSAIYFSAPALNARAAFLKIVHVLCVVVVVGLPTPFLEWRRAPGKCCNGCPQRTTTMTSKNTEPEKRLKDRALNEACACFPTTTRVRVTLHRKQNSIGIHGFDCLTIKHYTILVIHMILGYTFELLWILCFY